MNNKLYRSTRDSKLMGLCAGIGEWLNIDVTLIRVLFVLGVFFSGFTLLIPYFIVALVVPKEPLTPYGAFNFGVGQGQGCFEQNQYSFNNGYNSNSHHSNTSNKSSVDSVMEDVEKKAMINEIQQLRERLAKIEKGE